MIIPAITLWQPWASLMAAGLKCIETRSWPFPPRAGPLAIHAAADSPAWARDLQSREPFRSAVRVANCGREGRLPTGCVLAVCQVDGCARVGDRPPQTLAGLVLPPAEPERTFGDYSPGRWAWITSRMTALPTPVRCRGRQKDWPWAVPAELQDLVRRSVGEPPELKLRPIVDEHARARSALYGYVLAGGAGGRSCRECSEFLCGWYGILSGDHRGSVMAEALLRKLMAERRIRYFNDAVPRRKFKDNSFIAIAGEGAAHG